MYLLFLFYELTGFPQNIHNIAPDLSMQLHFSHSIFSPATLKHIFYVAEYINWLIKFAINIYNICNKKLIALISYSQIF